MLIFWRISTLEQRRSARKKRRFSIEQIVVVLKQAEIGLAVFDPIRRLRISEHAVYLGKSNIAELNRYRSRSSSARLKRRVE
jgi:putative transposase